ncbi:MAG: hypothetical protein OEN21_12790 [Myxococcales bacterium]|nr:hypothetical protein [Myxococcales bacterium]
MSVSRLAATSLVALLFLGCKSVGPNPKRVPREQALIPGAVPVTLVTLEASDAGYRLSSAKHFLGSPTPTILKDLPVLIIAHDAKGKLVGSVSVFNPREGHSLGTTRERQFTMPTGTVTVRFEDPKKKIRSVTVTVRSGPNSDQPPARISLGLPADSFGIVQ